MIWKNFFESIYNESLQRFTEIGKNNFWAKINANKTGTSYAQSFLQLDRGRNVQDLLRNFFNDFKDELQNAGLTFPLLIS